MKRSALLFACLLLSLSLITACGKKPGDLQVLDASQNTYPQVYPNPKNNKGQKIEPVIIEKQTTDET